EYPNPAFQNLTDADGYWAAKIVMSFTDAEIRAIVHTGRLSDPAAEEYLAKTLIQRRDKIGRLWLTRLSSFDSFELTPDGDLKFDHLASLYDFVPRPQNEVSWFTFDNATGEREPIAKFTPRENEGYYVAVISSAEGKVNVYIRNQGGKAQIVGV